MESGMGEVVIAPIYQVLAKRHVTFNFLSRLTNVNVAGRRVTKLHFEVLGQLQKNYSPYRKRVGLHGTFEYVPSTPPRDVAEAPRKGEFHRMHARWADSKPGRYDAVELTEDDHVILAIPPKVLKEVAPVLVKNEIWKACLTGDTKTASRPIASVQLWYDRPGDPANRIAEAVAAGHEGPLEVWADMSHILSREGFPQSAQELEYLCGPRPGDPAPTQKEEIDRVNAEVDKWLAAHGPYMLGRTPDGPRNIPPGEIHRYTSASLEPSDEYVLSLPNTIAHRVHPRRTGFTNLSVAGDWVKNGLDCGCAESAVTGGLLAGKSVP
jgi:uncharacterized protein with NAD-binding domain and iron-sulfur cluster